MRPGCQQLASVAANPPTPPSSHHHCEDPPVLPSVKGDPFTDGRTGGRPPGDGFCPSRGWLVSGQYAGAPRHSQVHPHKRLSGQRAPHLRYQARFPVSLTLHPANGRPPCHPEGHAFSHGPRFPAVLPPPLRPSAQEGPGDLRVCLAPASVPHHVEGAWEGGTHAQGRVLQGGHRLGPAWTAWGLALAQTVPTCTEGANLDRAACTLYNLA